MHEYMYEAWVGGGAIDEAQGRAIASKWSEIYSYAGNSFLINLIRKINDNKAGDRKKRIAPIGHDTIHKITIADGQLIKEFRAR